MKGVRFISVGIVALAALAIAPVAFSGFSAENTVALKKSGPYKDVVTKQLDKGESKTFYYKVHNQLEADETATLGETGFSFASDARVRWFRGDTNITSDVRGPGYEFDIGALKSKRFTVVVKALTNDAAACAAARATINDQGTEPFIQVNVPCTI